MSEWHFSLFIRVKSLRKYTRSTQDTYCHMFDLTQRIPELVLEAVQTSGHLHSLPISSPTGVDVVDSVLRRLDNKLSDLLLKSSRYDETDHLPSPYLSSAWQDTNSRDSTGSGFPTVGRCL
jgi:hypothetical protein